MWFRESLKSPEWIAAYALTIQIGIFAWQARILRRHAGTLEKHTDIAGKQEETAKLIGAALAQQQQIMTAQFKFQKQLEAQSERKIVFDLIMNLLTSVYSLTAKLSVVQYSSGSEVEEIREAWTRMDNCATTCQMALLGCEHMSREELKHFSGYLDDVSQLKQTNAANRADYYLLVTLNEKHKDFLNTVAKNRKAAIAAITSGT
jgi:hypothetical protein